MVCVEQGVQPPKWQDEMVWRELVNLHPLECGSDLCVVGRNDEWGLGHETEVAEGKSMMHPLELRSGVVIGSRSYAEIRIRYAVDLYLRDVHPLEGTVC